MSTYCKKDSVEVAKALSRAKAKAKTAAEELHYVTQFPDILKRIDECVSIVQVDNALTRCRRGMTG